MACTYAAVVGYNHKYRIIIHSCLLGGLYNLGDMGINLGTAQVINYAHSHDMAIQYWTINNEEDMRYLVSMGADCIMTDYPDKLYRVMVEMGKITENN